jgi:hypothetical protein
MSKINQRISFNLIRHRGTSADIPTFKLFKSFTSTLKKADSSIIILPFLASKQHYSSLSTLNHIKTLEENKLGQFFKSYHQQQLYSLGGYFHVSSEHTLEATLLLPLHFESYKNIGGKQIRTILQILSPTTALLIRWLLSCVIRTHPWRTHQDPSHWRVARLPLILYLTLHQSSRENGKNWGALLW